MSKLFPFTLLFMLPVFLQAYPVSVSGVVHQGNYPKSGELVVISSAFDAFHVLDTATTDDRGFFSFRIEVPNDIARGVLLVGLAGCQGPGAHQKRVAFSKKHTDHRVKLMTCYSQRDCSVFIKPVQRDSIGIYLKAHVKGETDNIVFRWNTGDSSETILAGDQTQYCVTITRADGCVADHCFLFDSTCTTTIHKTRLPNDSTFLVRLLANTKGQGPFSYNWSTGDTTKMIRVDTVGEYCVEVEDGRGCISRSCTRVSMTKDCTTEISVRPNFSSGAPQLHLVVNTRGQRPFSYKWNTGDSSKVITVDSLREYCVEVEDALGCISSDCIDLSQVRDSCAISIRYVANKHLMAMPYGLGPYQFEWSTGDSTQLLKIDSAGEYCVTITNGFGCTSSTCIVISDDQDSCRAKIVAKPRKSAGGVLLETIIRPRQDYQFSWDTGDTTPSIFVTDTGKYCVTILGESCQIEECIDVDLNKRSSLINQGLPEFASPKAQSAQLKAIPNPVINNFQLNWDNGPETGMVKVLITKVGGGIVYSESFNAMPGPNTVNVDLSGREAGIYFVRVVGRGVNKQLRLLKAM